MESGLKPAAGIASAVGKGLGLAVAAGTAIAAVGLGQAIDKGIAYQQNLNELQAVSQATALDMQRVGKVAKDLGADMTLPATSAADAAAAMVELAKGGLNVDQAMQAAKGTLQLAAAAQVDAAQAAEIQSNALNEFGLSADKAGHVADVLANTANAASGSIQDMANALKFVGPVAKGLGVSIDSVSAAIGLLANNGIQGEQAGTSLRGILASLASPSKAAAKAMRELGIVAFDQQGKFVGLRTITDQLAKAKAKLSQEEFAAAASTAFGNEGFTAANALANEGAKSFDEMATAVSRAGGAADVAAAKTKGLGGAWEGLKSQVETAQISIFEKLSPRLEQVVRGAADVVAKVTPAVVSGLDTAIAAGEVFGPRLADAVRQRASVIGDAVHDVLGPIAETVPDILNTGINAAIGLWDDFTGVLRKGVDAAKPAARGLADIAKAATESDGPLSAAATGLGLIGDGAKSAAGLLVPLGQLVGGLASAFADLPGPIQTAIIALGLAAAFKGPLGSLGDTVKDRVTAPFKNLGEEIRLQQALLTGSTDIMSAQIGKVGLAMAALESRVPIIGKIADAYRSGSTAAEGFVRSQAGIAAASLAIAGASERAVGAVQGAGAALGTFSGVVAGTGSALTVGMKGALTGLVSFLGGPWGVAIAAAGVGLSILAGKQQEAAKRAAEHKAGVEGVARALRDLGEIGGRQRIAEDLTGEFKDAASAAKGFGINLDDIVNSVSLGIPSTKAFADKLTELRNIIQDDPLSEQGQRALKVIGVIGELESRYKGAVETNKLLGEATRNSTGAMANAAGPTGELSKAMGILADKSSTVDDRVRALKVAFDALSGGQIGLESAQSSLNEQLDRLHGLFTKTEIASKGFAASLVTADGKFITTNENGRKFRDSLNGIAEKSAEVAQRTFEVTGSMDQAKGVIATAREQVIKSATDMHIGAKEANLLADSMHLIPDEVATLINPVNMTETQAQLDILKAKLTGLPPNTPVRVNALTDDAIKRLQDMGFRVTHLENGQFEVIAKTADANAELQGLVKRWNGFTINLDARIRGGVGGNIRAQLGLADGGIVQRFDRGGFARALTPMRADVASIVPPNTWRVVGDRMFNDEAFIPINRSARSEEILREAGRRMGFDVIQQGTDMIRRFALGGIAQQQSSRDMLRDMERPAVSIEKLEIRALSDRFTLQQIQDELYFNGVR